MAASGMNIQQKIEKEIVAVIRSSGSMHMNSLMPYTVKSITYNDFLSNKLLMMLVIRRGVPYSLFSLIQSSTPFSDNDWANFLGVSTKSLQRYKQSAKSFKPIHSEKIIGMAEVTNLGQDVFGEMKKFKLWLETPNFSLGNLKPVELLTDSYGKEMVMGELTRINHGIFV